MRVLGHLLGVSLGVALCAATPGTSELERNATTPPGPKLVLPASGVLFSDDFSDDLSKWRADRDDVWRIRRGMLRADFPDGKQQRSFIYAGDSTWTDVAVDLDVCMMRGVDKGVVVRVNGDIGLGVDLRGPGYQDVLLYKREWPLGRKSVPNANGVWHHLRVEVAGTHVRVFVNGELKIDRPDTRSAPESGRIALPAYTGGGGQCTVYYDNVLVTRLAGMGSR